jgi:hypothetical protein
MDMLGPLPYPVQNTLLDPGFPNGARNYWKSAYFKEITADTVSVMVARFAQTPSIMTGMVIEHFHSAVRSKTPSTRSLRTPEAGREQVDVAGVECLRRQSRECLAGLESVPDGVAEGQVIALRRVEVSGPGRGSPRMPARQKPR